MKKLLFSIMILVVLMCGSAFGATYYVTFSGSGNEDGSTYANSMAKTEFEAGDLGELDDDTVYLCDAWSNYVTLPDGGTSGHTATYRGDEGTYPYSFTDTSGDYAMVVTDIDYVDLRGFTIAGPGTDNGVFFGIVASGTADHTHIDDCTVSGFDFVAITFYGHDGYGSVTNCTISDCGNGIYIQNQDIAGGDYYLFADNTISDMNYSEQYNPVGTNRDGHAVGIQSASYCIVRNNEFYNTGSTAVSIGGGYQSKDAEYNAVFDNLIRDAQNTYAQSSAGQGLNIFNGVAADDTNYIIVYKNRFDTLNTGVKLFHDNLWNAVFNNTFYKCGWPNVAYSSTIILDGTDALHATNYKILNNLISSTSESRKIIYHLDDDVSATNTYDYNHYNPDYLAFSYQGAPGEAFATWQARGYDTNSTSTDATSSPGGAYLSDPENNDFTILPSSACINTGTTLTAINDAGGGSGTAFVVDDPYYFHDGYGLVDIDGTVEVGQTITIYDSTNGYQRGLVITDVNYATKTITVSTSVSWDDDATVALSYYGSAPDIGYYEYDEPPGSDPENDFSRGTNCIGHYILDDATNSSSSGATDNLTNAGTTTFVGGGAVLDGSTQYLYKNTDTGLSGTITDDFSIYASFTFDLELAANEVIASEYDGTDDQRVWILVLSDSAGVDIANLGIGYGGGASTKWCNGDFHLAHATRHYLIAQFDADAGDADGTAWIYMYNAAGTLLDTTTCTSFMGGETQNVEAVEFCIGCEMDADAVSAGTLLDGTVYEVAVTKDILDATERADTVKGEYSEPAGSFSSGSCSDATTAGAHSITLVSDVEVVGIHGDDVDDLPYISVTLDYLGPVLYYYVSSSSTNSTWTATLTAGMRQDSIDVSGGSVVLPNNATLTDLQDNNITLSLAAVDLTAQKIAVASTFTVTSVNTPGIYVFWLPGDDLTFITTTDEAIDTAVSGTAALPIILHIKTPLLTALTDNWTIDEDWWDIEGHRRIYDGTMTVDGSNNTVIGFSAASTGTGPAGFNTWMPYPFFLED